MKMTDEQQRQDMERIISGLSAGEANRQERKQEEKPVTNEFTVGSAGCGGNNFGATHGDKVIGVGGKVSYR